ncbi:MAG: hypothetical protein Q4D21_10530 [Phascolarctobacterium sp.]|nr:hypothetical protein [Phascolarctobacterium sp.]
MEELVEVKSYMNFNGDSDDESLVDRLMKKRMDQVRIFPHYKEAVKDYVFRYQGCKLSKKSVEALGRE